MQTGTVDTGTPNYRKLIDLPGLNPTEVLNNMPVCDEDTAFFIDWSRLASVRSTISNMDTKKEFSTKTLKAMDGGIIWRVK